MLERWISPLIIAVSISILAPLSTAATDGEVDALASLSMQSHATPDVEVVKALGLAVK